MNAKPPPVRRKFAGVWDEIGYLYDKLLYWLYQREDRAKARRYANRLSRLLPKADPAGEAIFGQECWSLVHEAEGDLQKAIRHRENEIRLIHRLHDIARKAEHSDAILQGYDLADLSDRLDLLATLYHDSGQLDKAITTLRESKQLCHKAGIPFDGDDLLREYLEEKERQAGEVPVRLRLSS